MPHGRGLSRDEVIALTSRFLSGQPGLIAQTRDEGTVYLCDAPLGHETEPCPFAVATDGGVLLRLDPETQERTVEKGLAVINAALPSWMMRHDDGTPAGSARVGTPDEWVWVPIRDGTAFERRRPHIHEAFAYCRHRMMRAA